MGLGVAAAVAVVAAVVVVCCSGEFDLEDRSFRDHRDSARPALARLAQDRCQNRPIVVVNRMNL